MTRYFMSLAIATLLAVAAAWGRGAIAAAPGETACSVEALQRNPTERAVDTNASGKSALRDRAPHSRCICRVGRVADEIQRHVRDSRDRRDERVDAFPGRPVRDAQDRSTPFRVRPRPDPTAPGLDDRNAPPVDPAGDELVRERATA